MIARPLLSYLVLSYNYDDYIGATLDSIRRQTVQDFEIVVVDDASTDSSIEVIRSYDDPRIRLFINNCNIGGAASYNRAVEAARGEWLVNLDADDWIAPEKAERQLAFAAANPDRDIVGTYVAIVDADGNRHPEADRIEEILNKPYAVEQLDTWFRYNPLPRSSTMVRRTSHFRIGLDDPAMVRAPDYELWTRFLRHGYQIGMVPEKLTFLRLQPRGITNGDPLATMLELAYAQVRNLLPLLEERAQHPPFLDLMDLLIGNPKFSTLSTAQQQRLVGLLMAPPPEGNFRAFLAYLADITCDSWLTTTGRRILAYGLEVQEKVDRLHGEVDSICARLEAARADAERWRQAAANLEADMACCYRSQSGVPEAMLSKMRTTLAYRLVAKAYTAYHILRHR